MTVSYLDCLLLTGCRLKSFRIITSKQYYYAYFRRANWCYHSQLHSILPIIHRLNGCTFNWDGVSLDEWASPVLPAFLQMAPPSYLRPGCEWEVSLSYGTDWLAYAHLVIAIAFIGPLRDPIKNIWVIQWGMICCLCVFPLAFIAGAVRGVPVYWQLVDCSLGVIGGILLYLCYRRIVKLRSILERT
jgi:hypothetical protein